MAHTTLRAYGMAFDEHRSGIKITRAANVHAARVYYLNDYKLYL